MKLIYFINNYVFIKIYNENDYKKNIIQEDIYINYIFRSNHNLDQIIYSYK